MKNAFRKTLNLPSTGLKMRANAVVREPLFSERTTTQLYAWQAQSRDRADAKEFILHDGPPYANGDLHAGHFLNKVLKDTMNRYQLLRGRRVRFVPGFDCHGLPIELKALKSKGSGDGSPTAIRALARECASEVIETHRRDFVRWGILADWDGRAGEGTYSTMSSEYEAKQLDVLLGLYRNGLLYRGVKPVHWSPSSRTALAEAELEYHDHTSTAVYVAFGLSHAPNSRLAAAVPDGTDLKTLVWTTTPWTLPSNTALAVNPKVEYSIVRDRGTSSNEAWIVASALLDSSAAILFGSSDAAEIVARVSGEDLRGADVVHPLAASDQSESSIGVPRKVLLGDHVTTDAGTGVVHTAPSHGIDDASAWIADGGRLEDCPCPLDDGGAYVAEGFPDDLAHIACALDGKSVLKEGNDVVVDALRRRGALKLSEDHVHRYPFDWRTKQPTIVRATPQWFAALDGIKDDCAVALESVSFIPESGKSRLTAAVLGRRADWCLSRQRCWGVPIPAFYGKGGEVLLNERTIARFQRLVSEHGGSDCWYDLPVEDLLPEEDRHLAAEGYTKGTDTLDVWFDRGCSWRAVLPENATSDAIVEGSDQHRGWFQSSLLTRIGSSASEQLSAPYKTVVTHGYVLDGEGRKMSKSVGNVVGPSDIITPKPKSSVNVSCGADALRFWACSSDYTADVWMSEDAVRDAAEAVFRIRNTCRFLLGNLSDYSDDDMHTLRMLDRHMLARAAAFRAQVADAYDRSAFLEAARAIKAFVSEDVSALYSTCVKDRLYARRADDPARRGAQRVARELLRTVLLASAPIAPHMAEEVFEHARKEVRAAFPGCPDDAFSAFQLPWDVDSSGDAFLDDDEASAMGILLSLRSELHRRIAQSDGDVTLKNAVATITYGPECPASRALALSADALEFTEVCEILGVSQCRVVASSDLGSEAQLRVEASSDAKCDRCWLVSETVDPSTGIFSRCDGVLQ